MLDLGVLFVVSFFIRNKNNIFNGYHNKAKLGVRGSFLPTRRRKRAGSSLEAPDRSAWVFREGLCPQHHLTLGETPVFDFKENKATSLLCFFKLFV